ncbi:hypothetical protein MTP10_30695 [Nonomuraea sp. 3-1Str]|uniref:SRPBCC family protein n=1 Tax=Nonomuraea sp. 3-1Str TaxID=2929801 RepID=UPI002865D060|nr:hypothetical protein [Nonomuraea sp. 3-1Str]MDR8413087.1 hypothetical protein [Nonomuraea sp. 3-1Str]
MPADRDSGADSATVSLRRHFDCDFADLWEAVSSPGSVSAWFTPCRLEPDRRYSLRFTEDSGETHVKYATVLDCRRRGSVGEYRLLLQDEGYSDSTVEVRVGAAARTGSTLELRHLHPPPELADGYARGWADYLDCLRRHLAAAPPVPADAAAATRRAGGPK